MMELDKDQANPIPFVMVDSNGDEVTGLTDTFTVTLSKNGSAFGASAGAKSELGNGWYLYTATAGECDTGGALALRITGAGADQQNLVYLVRDVPAEVWANTARTLTMTSAEVEAVLVGDLITIHRGDTLVIPFAGLGSIAGRSKLWFTMKTSLSHEDSQSIIQVEEGAGLLYINGAAAGTPANGTITVNDEDNGDFDVILDEVEAAKLTRKEGMYYDCQVLIGTAVTTLTHAYANVELDVTRATS